MGQDWRRSLQIFATAEAPNLILSNSLLLQAWRIALIGLQGTSMDHTSYNSLIESSGAPTPVPRGESSWKHGFAGQ